MDYQGEKANQGDIKKHRYTHPSFTLMSVGQLTFTALRGGKQEIKVTMKGSVVFCFGLRLCLEESGKKGITLTFQRGVIIEAK